MLGVMEVCTERIKEESPVLSWVGVRKSFMEIIILNLKTEGVLAFVVNFEWAWK